MGELCSGIEVNLVLVGAAKIVTIHPSSHFVIVEIIWRHEGA